MIGIIKKLKDNSDNYIIPITSSKAVYMADGVTLLEDKINALPTGSGDMSMSVYDISNNGTVDDAEKLGGNLPTYYAKQSDMASIQNDINNGVVLNPVLAYGMNGVIKNTGKVSQFPKITFIGKSYVNLLGKDGNCEDLTKWTANSVTATLDTANKVFGNNAIKITIGVTGGTIYKTLSSIPTLNITKYYFISAYVKNGNATDISLQKDNVGGGTILTSTVTDSSKFNRVCLRAAPSDLNISNNVYLILTGSAGQYAYVDGIMINEISAAEYTLTDAQLLAKYPYVDSYACLENPYIEVKHDNLVRNGNGEEGVAWWTASGSVPALSIVNGKFQLITTEAGNYYYQRIKVKSNSTYYIKYNVTGETSIQVFDGKFNNMLYGGTIGGTISTGPYTEIVVLIRNLVIGAGTADSIHLIEGTNPPTTYLPCRIERTVIEGKFADGDSVVLENGKASGSINNKHEVLYGKDYDWVFNGDAIGYKKLQLGFNHGQIPYTGSTLIKYDGRLLPLNGTLSVTDTQSVDTITAYVAVTDTDTGWTEAINPNNDEVKAFMNGWKATANNGTRYTSWVSVVDLVTVPTSQLISFVNNNIAQNYEGYQLHYKLANLEPITDVNFKVEGDIPKFDVGDNYVTIDSGIVLGEVACSYGTDIVDAVNDTIEVVGNITNDVDVLKKKLASDLAESVQQTTDLKQHTIIKSNKDSNAIYTTITLKRTDNTIYCVSVLSVGTSPNYTKRTETYYKLDGTTVDSTKIYTRTYDSDGLLLSEVMI